MDELSASMAALDSLTSAVNNIINVTSQENTNKSNQQFAQQQTYTQQFFNNENQKYLWENEIPEKLKSLRKAGFNPALLTGSELSGGAAANSSPLMSQGTAPQVQFGGVLDNLVKVQQLEQQSENLEATKLKNKEQDIKNKSDAIDLFNKQEENDLYARQNVPYMENDDGVRMSIDEWKEKGEPDGFSISVRPGSKGYFSGVQQIQEWETRKGELSAQRVEQIYRKANAELNAVVAHKQLSDADVLNALVKMPPAQLNQLYSSIRGQNIQNALSDLMLMNEKDGSVGALFNELGDKNMSFGAKALSVIKYIARQFKGASFSFSK